MQATRCKFRCESVTKVEHHTRDELGKVTKEKFLYRAKFSVVYGDSPENKAFFDATPSGTLEIGVYTEDKFVPGREYYLDIIPCDQLPQT